MHARTTSIEHAAPGPARALRLVRAAATLPVLLVEDEPTIAVTLGDDLVGHGFRVVHTADGADAVQRLAGCAFAAVITDLRLPGADGIAVLKAARAHGIGSVLVISAYAASRAEDLRAHGVDVVIQKPFCNEQVLAWLCAAIGRP
jgi:CheY-like chemotaxis protein